jgi:hypothetical protein
LDAFSNKIQTEDKEKKEKVRRRFSEREISRVLKKDKRKSDDFEKLLKKNLSIIFYKRFYKKYFHFIFNFSY